MYLSVAQFSFPRVFYPDETIPTARTEALWVYVLENSEFALRFVPSIFGPVLEDFARKGLDGVWAAFDPLLLPDEHESQPREPLLFPMLRVLELELPKETVLLQKNDLAKYFPAEILNPGIETVVQMIAELHREQKALCLLDCRSLLEHYCGYRLHGPFGNHGNSKGTPEQLEAQPAQEDEAKLRVTGDAAKDLIRERELLAKTYRYITEPGSGTARSV